MPSPSTSLATLRPDIAASLEEFDLMMNVSAFIGHRVFPVFTAGEASGHFGRIKLEQLLQRRETRRSPGSGYSRGNWEFEKDTYITEEHGAEEPIDDNEAAAYANYFDMEVVSAARAMHAVLENQERRVRDAVLNTSVFTEVDGLATPVTIPWDSYETATPIDDVEAAVRSVYFKSGLWPNALVLSRIAFRNLRMCEQILDRISASGAGDRIRATDVTAAQLAQVFDLDQILVGGGSTNLAAKGQDRDIAQIWDTDKALVARVATSGDMREPCIGRTFHWPGDGSDIDGRVETYRSEEIRADVVRVRHQTDEKLYYREAGHLLLNIEGEEGT